MSFCQILVKDACTYDQSGVQCIWYDLAGDEYCLTSECSKADSSYSTESQCLSISPTCTAKAQKGCKEKTTCSSIERQEYCTQSIDGFDCKWNNNKCEEYLCSSLEGKSHFDCKAKKPSCTISATGKCYQMQSSCELYKLEAACVETLTNQACQWVAAYSDTLFPNGKCVPYKSCTSIPLTSDTQCKKISKYCTGSEQSCASIKLCKDTQNSNCVTGSDGSCMLSYTSEQASAKTCQLFEKCSNIKFLTHQECFNANNSCTTDGTTGELISECAGYKTKFQCNIRKDGKQTDADGAITKTGKCVFGGDSCRDEICEDLESETQAHNFCNNRLKTCTTDGKKCVSMQKCEMYESIDTCNKGRGLDGMCYWDLSVTTMKKCKLQKCTEVQYPSSDICSSIKSCIYDGEKKCIERNSCKSYSTQFACQQGSLEYSACQWNTTTSICKQAATCDDLASDSAACTSDQNCFFASTCKNKNCQNLYSALNICTNYRDKSNQTKYCKKNNNTCESVTDLTTLVEGQCLVNSQYTYTFKNNACRECNLKTIINNTNSSTTGNTTNITTTGSYYLGINFLWVALLAYN